MKSEVYSWRVSRDLKAALEQAAREEGVSVAMLLERMTREWLSARASGVDDEAEQARLRASSMRFVGRLCSGDPDLSAKASERLRERLTKAHARSRSD